MIGPAVGTPQHRTYSRVPHLPRSPAVVFCNILLDLMLLAGGAAYLTWSLINALSTHQASVLCELMLFSNGMLALFGIMRSIRKSLPLFSVFFCFDFLFFGLAPLQQIAARWDEIFLRRDLLAEATAICLFFTLTAWGFIFARDLWPPRRRHPNFLSRSLLNPGNLNTLTLLVVAGATTAFLLIYYGSALFTNRETLGSVLAQESEKSTKIFIRGFLHPFVFVAGLVGLVISHQRRDRLMILLFGMVFFGAILINNPISQARFHSSSLLLFAVLAVFGSANVRFIIWFIFAGIALSPIYNTFFRYKEAILDNRSIDRFFVHMDYDALDIFCYTIAWVRHEGIEYGSNLLGAVFFFVPRSIWPDKGVHVAAVIFDYLNLSRGFTTDNLSSPPPVEGYLSFGLLGALVTSFVVIVAIDLVERRGSVAEAYSPWRLILCLSPILVMIVLRGPFQVGFSEWILHAFTIVTMMGILRLGGKRRVINSVPKTGV
jgi:hypothetical protein